MDSDKLLAFIVASADACPVSKLHAHQQLTSISAGENGSLLVYSAGQTKVKTE